MLVQKVNESEKRYSRWQGVLRESAEQSGRGCIPELRETKRFRDSVAQSIKFYELTLAAGVQENQDDLKSILGGQVNLPASIGVFTRPEGGFDPEEVEWMRANEVRMVTLGRRILRMETAAILMPALVLYQLGDLGRSE